VKRLPERFFIASIVALADANADASSAGSTRIGAGRASSRHLATMSRMARGVV